MKSTKFWTLTLALMASATVLFSQITFASPAARAKPRVVVRIGKPYTAVLRRKVKVNRFNPEYLRNEDANAQYLSWRNSVRFRDLRGK